MPQKTLSPLAQHIAKSLHRWARRNSDGFFRTSSRYLQKTFGNQYAKAMKELCDIGALQISSPHQFDPAKPGEGRSRGYTFHKMVDAPEPEVTLPADYQALRARTNIAQLTNDPYYVEGRNGDARVYTEFTALSKDRLPELLIDGEPVVQFDTANAFPLFLGRAIGAGEDYMELAVAGRLNDQLSEWLAMGGYIVSRDNVKLAINKIINSPRSRLRFGWLVEAGEGIYYTNQTTDDKEQSLAAKFFKRIFPAEYKAFRRLARAGKGVAYRLGAKEEARLRSLITEKARKSQITIITRHDAVLCKASDVERLWSILRSVSAKFTLTSFSSLPVPHLICTNPVMEQFFTFEVAQFPSKSPPEHR